MSIEEDGHEGNPNSLVRNANRWLEQSFETPSLSRKKPTYHNSVKPTHVWLDTDEYCFLLSLYHALVEISFLTESERRGIDEIYESLKQCKKIETADLKTLKRFCKKAMSRQKNIHAIQKKIF